MRQNGYFLSPADAPRHDLDALRLAERDQQATAEHAWSQPTTSAVGAGGGALLSQVPTTDAAAAGAAGAATAGLSAAGQSLLQSDLEWQIGRTQQVADSLAQDAAALSAELQALSTALRAAPATPEGLAQLPTTASPSDLLSLDARQVPYLPPPDANALAGVEAGETAAAAAKEAVAPQERSMPLEVKAQPPSVRQGRVVAILKDPTFRSKLWTLDSRLSGVSAVVVWSLVLLTAAGCCGFCCLSLRRRDPAHPLL